MFRWPCQRDQWHGDLYPGGLIMKPQGIGDLLKYLLAKLGIDALLAGLPCGCEQRRKVLNFRWWQFFIWLEGWTWKRLTYCPCENS